MLILLENLRRKEYIQFQKLMTLQTLKHNRTRQFEETKGIIHSRIIRGTNRLIEKNRSFKLINYSFKELRSLFFALCLYLQKNIEIWCLTLLLKTGNIVHELVTELFTNQNQFNSKE
jgi:hypothetical protein